MNAMIVDGVEYRLFNHLYAVSRSGVAIRVRTQEIVTPHIRSNGYCGIASKMLLHRMVATCWVTRPIGTYEVHHINEDKTDNRADNLIWVTRREHMNVYHDASLLGKYERTDETIRKLREYRTGRKTTENTKLKQRLANLRLGIRPPVRPIGFKVPADQVTAQSENHWRNTTCEVDGIEYRSFAEAGRALGIRPLTLRKRCLSKGFPNYRLARK